jgi:raffinose/stachyose/melibiose transport system permease protein
MSERPRWLHAGLLVVFALYALTPVYLVILASLRNEADLFAAPLSLPLPVNFANYARVWIENGFAKFFLNSLIMSGASTIIVILVAPAAGYAFAKLEFRGREVLFGLFLAGLVIPAPSVIVALYGNLQAVGLIDSYIGVILPQAAILLPFAVFMMRTVMQDVPNELIEAGKIDGINTFRSFLSIALPVSRPALGSLALIVFLFSWQEYLLPLVVIQSESLKPLTVGAATLQGRYGVDYASIAAAGVIAFMPLVALFLVMQRTFVRGLTVGAVK